MDLEKLTLTNFVCSDFDSMDGRRAPHVATCGRIWRARGTARACKSACARVVSIGAGGTNAITDAIQPPASYPPSLHLPPPPTTTSEA
jgi:hypothetical protein